MAKVKNNVEETVVAETPKVVEVKEVKEKAVEYPEGNATGRFHSVAFNGGYVVYNPAGQRATKVVTKIVADDIVRQNNQAAHIK